MDTLFDAVSLRLQMVEVNVDLRSYVVTEGLTEDAVSARLHQGALLAVASAVLGFCLQDPISLHISASLKLAICRWARPAAVRASACACSSGHAAD